MTQIDSMAPSARPVTIIETNSLWFNQYREIKNRIKDSLFQDLTTDEARLRIYKKNQYILFVMIGLSESITDQSFEILYDELL